MSTIHRVAGCDDKSRVADIIFVHGLNPTSRDQKAFAFGTWGGSDASSDFWPKWLYEDLKDGGDDGPVSVGVWVLEYDSAAMGWVGHTMPLSDRAANILDQFWGDNLGRRPIIFITHSLGGLVVKEILHRGLTENKDDWTPIAKSVRGVVFLATPHSGADFAGFIEKLKIALRLTESVAELKANAPALRKLSEWYRDNAPANGIATRSYCEKVKTFGVLVVDETSANPFVPRSTPTPLDTDHSGVAKPTSRDAQQYKGVLRFIRECLAEPSPPFP
jgi:pimeloyl-ACP methyl ester carboxylesterase